MLFECTELDRENKLSLVDRLAHACTGRQVSWVAAPRLSECLGISKKLH